MAVLAARLLLRWVAMAAQAATLWPGQAAAVAAGLLGRAAAPAVMAVRVAQVQPRPIRAAQARLVETVPAALVAQAPHWRALAEMVPLLPTRAVPAPQAARARQGQAAPAPLAVAALRASLETQASVALALLAPAAPGPWHRLAEVPVLAQPRAWAVMAAPIAAAHRLVEQARWEPLAAAVVQLAWRITAAVAQALAVVRPTVTP